MTMPLVRVIIVNYNGGTDTIECLQSLAAQTHTNYLPLVVDNASADNSVSAIQSAFPDTEILQTRQNLGFAGGNNIGIRHALEKGCEYLFLVNNDTTMEPDCLSNLIACAEAYPVASVIAPAMYYYSDKSKPWFTGSTLDMVTGESDHRRNDLRAQKVTHPFEIPWASGCAMLIPSGKMEQIKGFDERFFCYWEDIDLCLRTQKLHSTCMLCPTATLYHKVSATAKKQGNQPYYYMGRNQMLCFSKQMQKKQWRRWMINHTLRVFQQTKHIFRFAQDNAEKRMALAKSIGVIDFHLRRFGRCRHSWL